MKRLILTALLSFMTIVSWADVISGTCGDNASFVYDSSTGALTVSGTGAIKDYDNGNATPWYNYRSSIKSVVIGEGITAVGSHTFRGFENAEELCLPSTLVSIGAYAFPAWYKLQSVELPNSVKTIGEYAFADNVRTSTLKLSNSLQTIGAYAFGRMFLLETVVIPNSVTSMGEGAFWACRSLRELTIGRGLTSIATKAFEHCSDMSSLTIPSTITSIMSDAFNDCARLFEIYNLSSLNIVAGDTTYGQVGRYAKIINKSTSIPSVISLVDGYMFGVADGINYLLGNYYCHYDDEAIVLPESFNGQPYVVNDFCFWDFTSSTSLTIPQSVTKIGRYAFPVSYLKTVTCYAKTPPACLENESPFIKFRQSLCALYVPSMALEAYAKAEVWKDFASIEMDPNEEEICSIEYTTTDGQALILPTRATSIFKDAEGNKIIPIKHVYENGVGRLSFSSHVAYIGDVFASPWGSSSTLNSILLPECVKELSGTFTNCRELTSISIPPSVESIGSYTFSNCNNLTKAEFASIEALLAIDFCEMASNPLYYANHLYIAGEEIHTITIPDAVTKIKDYVFFGCTDISSVSIPNNVTSIGNSAFADCTSLTSVNLPNSITSIGNYAFDGCTSLTSVEIPSGITSIGNSVFRDCTSLTSVEIPNGVTSIGNSAFAYCTSLTSVNIPNSVTSIGSSAFSGCKKLSLTNIPANLSRIESSTFSGCASLTDVTIPSSVNYIGNYAFNGSGLRSVTIPNGVSSIQEYTFMDCANLKFVSIPSSVTSIARLSFSGCASLESVVIPEGVTRIESQTFYGCEKLSSVTISSTVNYLDGNPFGRCPALSSILVNSQNKTFDSRDNCNGIVNKAYSSLVAGCKTTVIPEGVSQIDPEAFAECLGLTSFSIPEGVADILPAAFIGCKDLKRISIPASMRTIHFLAFTECTSLASITCNGTVPPAFYKPDDYDAAQAHFYLVDKSKCTLYVPEGSVEAYRTADVWMEFSHIEPTYPQTDIAALTDAVYIESQELFSGASSTLAVKMKNTEANITGFQFDLYLPEGITIATDEYGDAQIAISGGRTTLSRHSVSCQPQADGAMRVACTSLNNSVFSGNDGEVLSISIHVAEDVEDGEYPVILKKIELTTPTLVQYKTDYVKSALTVSSYTPGDVNNDHDVTVADVAGVVNFILNTNTEGLNRKAADINKDDEITVADAAGTVNILLGVAPASSPLRVQAKGSAAMNILPFMLQRGEQIEVPVVLNGYASSMTGLQFDLALPAGLRLVEVLSDKRHQTAFAEQADQRVRIVAISNRNATFTSASEAITLVLEADGSLQDGQLEISDIEMVRPDMSVSKQAGFTTSFSLSEATGIQTLEQSVHTKIYDLQGRQVRQVQGGIYIVDGKKKVIK